MIDTDTVKNTFPKTNNYFDLYTIKTGDTLYNIANKSNIDATLLASLNGINIDDYIYPQQVLLIPRPGTILYISAIGDTIQEVAKGINVNINDLIKQNDKIYLQPEQLIIYQYK